MQVLAEQEWAARLGRKALSMSSGAQACQPCSRQALLQHVSGSSVQNGVVI